MTMSPLDTALEVACTTPSVGSEVLSGAVRADWPEEVPQCRSTHLRRDVKIPAGLAAGDKVSVVLAFPRKYKSHESYLARTCASYLAALAVSE